MCIGHLTRRAMEEVKQHATTIQAVWRAYQVRTKLEPEMNIGTLSLSSFADEEMKEDNTSTAAQGIIATPSGNGLASVANRSSGLTPIITDGYALMSEGRRVLNETSGAAGAAASAAAQETQTPRRQFSILNGGLASLTNDASSRIAHSFASILTPSPRVREITRMAARNLFSQASTIQANNQALIQEEQGEAEAVAVASEGVAAAEDGKFIVY